MLARRIFIRDGGLAVLGMSIVPGFIYRTAMAAQPGRKKVLVAIFQRGGVDGLNVVVPFGEKHYYEYRPTIAVPPPLKDRTSAIDLNGFFGLHPSMESLLPMYKDGHLAIVHAAGSPHPTRSHFEAQDFMESAAPGDKTVADGWLNRYMHHFADQEVTTFRGVSTSRALPRALEGKAPALSVGDLLAADMDADARSMFQSMYDTETNALLSGASKELFDAIRKLKEANPGKYEPAQGIRYPMGQGGGFGRSLRTVAQLIKADLGLEIAFVDVGGWDTHANQGGVDPQNGQLPGRLQGLSQALAAFYKDLGDRMDDVVVLTMSEFGRTARENGNVGTDHGKANVMFLMGGAVKGGKIYGDWPGLAPEQLNESRDLAMTTDFRDVFAEVLVRHLGCANPNVVFPGFSVDATRFRGVLA